MKTFLAILVTLLACLPVSAHACGSSTDCLVHDRLYRIHIPASVEHSDQIPALVFAHGYRGTAAGVMKNKALLNWADKEEIAVIAAQSDGPGWDLPYGPRTYDSDGAAEETYFEAVLEDAANRFPLDRSQVVMSGFSAGGMITWHLACRRPDLFAGFIPVAGTFWLKPPEVCEKPVRSLVHIHGNQDTVVPFEGRQIRITHQGSIFDAFDLYRAVGVFEHRGVFHNEGLDCRSERNENENEFLFCTFDGGHEFRVRHVAFAWERLMRKKKS